MDSSGGQPRSVTCESCVGTFECSAHAGVCWCENVNLSSETLALFRGRFSDYICPNCLKETPVSG